MTNNGKKTNRQKRTLIGAILIAAVIMAGSTFAWFTSKDEVTNRLSADASYNVSIVESFEPPANWIPGQEINKDVYAVNTGNIPAFVKETISGVLTIKHENAADDFDPNCVQLTAAERYVVEAGAYLAWKPDKSAKQLGKEVVNMVVNDSTTLDGYQYNDKGLTDFEPDVDGLYVFRRKITVDSAYGETFEYSGYYYKNGKFYKITNLTVTENGNGNTVANDGNNNDGQLATASADYVKEVSKKVDPVNLSYNPSTNELLATYDTGITATHGLEQLAEAYDKALAEYERANEALNRAKADAGVEVGGGSAEELAEKKQVLDEAYSALQTAYTEQRDAQAAYNRALTDKTNAQNAYDAAKRAVDESKVLLYGSDTGTETNYTDTSLKGKYVAATNAKNDATTDSRIQFQSDFEAWASTHKNAKGTTVLADYTYDEFSAFPASDIVYTYYQAVANEKLAQEVYEAELTKLHGSTDTSEVATDFSLEGVLTTATAVLGDKNSGKIKACNDAEATLDTKKATYTTAQDTYNTALAAYNTALAANNIDNAEYNKALADYQNAVNKRDATEKAYNAAIANGTGSASSILTIHIKLADTVVPMADGSNNKWQLLSSILEDSVDVAEFCYTGILKPGQTSSKLIDSVELDKMTTKEMYKSFDFDLNVSLSSVQIAYDTDNETILGTSASQELNATVTLSNDKSLDTALAWSVTTSADPVPVYTAVTPENGDNPKENGWYEKTGENEYTLTEDTAVQDGKTYYTKS